MNRIYILGIMLFFTFSAHSQLVLTVAGQVDSVGATNGPANLASFTNPHDVAVDPAGNIYVADRFGNRIRKIDANGVVSTLAGTGQQGAQDGPGNTATFYEPWGLCVDSAGNVFVADTRNNLIRKIDPAGNVSTYAGTGNFGTSDGAFNVCTFGNPTGVEVTSDGSLYVADHLTHIIRRIDPSGFVTTIAGSPFSTGTADGVGGTARFNRPYGLAIDNNGDILVADEWNHTIRRVTTNGIVTTIAGTGIVGSSDGPALGSTFNFPWDVVVDSTGNVYIADGYNDVIRKMDVAGNVTTYVGTAGNSGANDGTGAAATFNAATGLAYLGPTDEIYVADAFNNLVRKIINLNQQTVAIQITQGTPVFCEGDSLTIKASPEIYDSYDFYVDNILVQSSTDANYQTSTLTVGVHALRVTAYDNGTAVNSNNFQVTVNPTPAPNITIIGDTTFFLGDSVTFIASSGDHFLWSNGDTVQSITVKTSGNYSVQVTNSAGCTGTSDVIQVDAQQFSVPPVITFEEGSADLCFGELAILSSDYDENNQWLLDGFPIQGATEKTYEVLVEGTYQVQAQDSLGFTLISDPIDITIKDKQIQNFFASDTIIVVGSTVQFTPYVNQTGLDFFWSFGDDDAGIDNLSNDESPSYTYNDAGTYDVQLITADVLGCSDTLEKTTYIIVNTEDGGGSGGGNNDTISIAGGDSEVFIPTAFTPNGDGQNDVFRVRGDNIADLELYIYNQWGEKIFESFDINTGWRGIRDGAEVQNATYVYVVKVTMDDGREKNFAGHVTLLK